MNNTEQDFVDHVCDRTGLSQETVQELLNSDWTYIQDLYKPDRWVR